MKLRFDNPEGTVDELYVGDDTPDDKVDEIAAQRQMLMQASRILSAAIVEGAKIVAASNIEAAKIVAAARKAPRKVVLDAMDNPVMLVTANEKEKR